MSQWIGSRAIDVEMIDGVKHATRTIFADAVAFESTARKHGWGTGKDGPLQSIAFVAWHALRREGGIPASTTFESFRDSIAQVRVEDESEERPTPPAPPPG